jgi:ferredoxin
MTIKRVWIEEGCIVCNACETTCPEVFNVTEDSCNIRAESRVDGQQTTNLSERSEVKPEFQESLADQIEEAAEGCPVEVIKFEKG